AATYLTVCLSSLVVEAEYRTWTAATGNFTTEAEFVGRKSDDFVALRRRDGTILNVRLSQLSAADVAYVAGMASVTPPAVPPLPAGAKLMDAAEADRALKSVEREAQACKTAQGAAALYAVFLSDPTLPSTARAAA